MRRRFALAALLALPFAAAGQNERDEVPLVNVSSGLSFTKDSVFMLNLRFRMQNRLGFATAGGDDLSVASTDFRVRRLRLRLDGYMLDERIRYYVQLNFSRADLDLESDEVAQPLRDALAYYFFSDRFYIGVGQGKLPGNRQRVISSGNLQFPDRSIANAAFTLDRDVGLFAYGTIPLGAQQAQVKGAVTSGEGRNALVGDAGLCYTGRVEWLPLGAFANSGDYSEGDLEMEPRPKLSVGACYSYNHRARRSGGQLGPALYAPADIGTFIADGMLKWQGWALMGEYFDRTSTPSLTISEWGAIRAVTTGTGASVQLSKHWRSHFELAGRYARIRPGGDAAFQRPSADEALLCATRYLKGHRIKLQAQLGYRWADGEASLSAPGSAWSGLFQVEFGI